MPPPKEAKTERIPTIKNAKTCSLIINIEPVKRLQYPDIYNASCTIHAHTIPSESVAVILTVKDAESRDDAVMRVAEAAETILNKLEWELVNVEVHSPETLGAQ